LIFDIKRSRLDSPTFLSPNNIALYSQAFCFATSGDDTICKISPHSTTLSNHTMRPGSPGRTNFTFFDV